MGSCNSIGIRFSYTRWINSIEICWAFFLAYTLICVSLTELYVHVFWPFLCQALVFLTLRVIYKLRRLSLCLCGRYFLTACNLSFFLSDVIFFHSKYFNLDFCSWVNHFFLSIFEHTRPFNWTPGPLCFYYAGCTLCFNLAKVDPSYCSFQKVFLDFLERLKYM